MDRSPRFRNGWTGALLDRLTHHVHILEMNGESYRLKQSKRKRGSPAELLIRRPPTPTAVNTLGEEDVFRSGLNAPPFRRRRPPLQTPSSPTIPDLLPTHWSTFTPPQWSVLTPPLTPGNGRADGAVFPHQNPSGCHGNRRNQKGKNDAGQA